MGGGGGTSGSDLSHGSDRGPVFGGESVVGLSVGVLG